MTAVMASFSTTDPIVPGVTLVEASAGTGKTYSIASLFLRLVAERGLPVDQILVVTFTNAATSELRGRIRERLVEAVSVLEASVDGRPHDQPKDLDLALLLQAPSDELRVRLRRLRSAREDFDLAAISTIHGFCQRMLGTYAFESGTGFDLELVADTAKVVDEILGDYLTRRACTEELEVFDQLVKLAKLGDQELRQIARDVMQAGGAELEPAWGDAWRNVRCEWLAAIEEFRQFWVSPEGEAAVVPAIVAECERKKGKRLDGSAYQSKRTYDHAKSFGEWLATGGVPTPGWRDRPWARYFSEANAVAKKASKSEEVFSHPGMAAWDRVLAGNDRYFDGARAEFAGWVRREVRKRLLARSQQSFDDLLSNLADKIASPGGGPLIAAIRRKYRAALIDEFQDTDSVQWAIFSRVFADDPEAILFLIGDPKQAIYSFRGADVFVYRDARKRAQQSRTMTVNYRSEKRYVQAMNCLYGEQGCPFGLDFINYVPVVPSAEHEQACITLPQGRAPLQLRWFDARCVPGMQDDAKVSKEQGWRVLPGLVAEDVASLLSSGVRIVDPKAPKGTDPWRAVRPGDVAVLVRKHRQARAVCEALGARGLPAIISQAGSVFDTEQAVALGRWLDAVAEPGSESRARALAITAEFGWTAAQIDEALRGVSHSWRDWMGSISGWHRKFEQRGFAVAIHEALTLSGSSASPSPTERLLGLRDGERRLTNLRHVVELAQQAAQGEHLGPSGLARWLWEQRERTDIERDAAQLRLESEADAVQVVTLHTSKGLQYSVVVLPYFWDGRTGIKPGHVRYHPEDGTSGVRLDLSLDTKSEPGAGHKARAEAEAVQEGLRLLYVGLTRARYHAVAYWGLCGEEDAPNAPLGIALHGAGAKNSVPVAQRRIALAINDKALRGELLADLGKMSETSRGASDAPPTIGWSVCMPASDGRWADPQLQGGQDDTLRTRLFTRSGFGTVWRRVSYSALTHGKEVDLAKATADSEKQQDAGQDHDDEEREAAMAVALPLEPAKLGGAEPDVPLAVFLRGTGPGKFVHKVFEELDFVSLAERADKRASQKRSLLELVESLGRRMGLPSAVQHALLSEHLPRILETPLLRTPSVIRLRDLGVQDRLDELRFDLPLAGRERGDVVKGEDFAKVFLERKGDAAMPQEYIDLLQGMKFGMFAGFLTGSIDLVFRAVQGEHEKWFVADYKTNRLGEWVETEKGERRFASTARHYSHDWMRAEMMRHNYFVQYHLYLVALHRYLRWRKPDYDYDRHVGGALYLFVRGMTSSEGSRDGDGELGVFHDKPPRAVIERLSTLFEGQAGGVR